MDTSAFILKRKTLRDHMDAERARLLPVANGEKPALWSSLLSLGMKWGLLPMVQDWAVTSMSRWVYDRFSGVKSRR